MRFRSLSILATAVALSGGAVACSGDGSPVTAPSGESGSGVSGSGGSGGGGSLGGGTGTLSMSITDSPFSDAQALLVTFNEVSAHRSEGTGWESLTFAGGATRRTCDLKKLQGPVDVLGSSTVPAGHYTQIRLNVESAALYFDNPSVGPACAPAIAAPAGDTASVEIPSGEVKLNTQFTLAAGGTTSILLDFDGDQSVRRLGGGNAGSNGGGGNGNGRGNSGGGEEEEEEDDPASGRYSMNPVIRIVSVN
jgi:hypothetical protein